MGVHFYEEYMGIISNAVANNATSWMEVPDTDGFEVELQFLTREHLQKIQKASLEYKFSKKTRQREEEVDTDKFLSNYAKKAIINWRGLTIGTLPKLMPADISNLNADEEIPFSEEDALDLLKNSSIFDQFVTDAMNDYEEFSTLKDAEEVKN